MSVERCPQCGRLSVEHREREDYCLYADCSYRKPIRTLEERVQRLERAVEELWGKDDTWYGKVKP